MLCDFPWSPIGAVKHWEQATFASDAPGAAGMLPFSIFKRPQVPPQEPAGIWSKLSKSAASLFQGKAADAPKAAALGSKGMAKGASKPVAIGSEGKANEAPKAAAIQSQTKANSAPKEAAIGSKGRAIAPPKAAAVGSQGQADDAPKPAAVTAPRDAQKHLARPREESLRKAKEAMKEPVLASAAPLQKPTEMGTESSVETGEGRPQWHKAMSSPRALVIGFAAAAALLVIVWLGPRLWKILQRQSHHAEV